MQLFGTVYKQFLHADKQLAHRNSIRCKVQKLTCRVYTYVLIIVTRKAGGKTNFILIKIFHPPVAIDIGRLSRPPPAPSTCDFMHNRQRPPLYYGGQKQKYCTIWPPPPQISLHRRAALTTNSNRTKSAHSGKRGGGLETIFMSMPEAAKKTCAHCIREEESARFGLGELCA
jgi:hypothetical protein